MLPINDVSLRSVGGLAALAESALRPDFTLSGFPEYATDADTLAPDQQRILRDATATIVASQASFQPVVAAIIIGHADKALRKPTAERAAFELEISQHRADAAAASLLRGLIRESAGAHYAKTFRSMAIGIGNARPRYANATTEQQMQQNRRVEISLCILWLGQPRCGVT